MTNVAVIENKISSIIKYLDQLEEFKKFSKEEIISDAVRLRALERYLYLVTQASIDLAEAIISLKQWRKPVTMSESFSILSEKEVIDSDLSGKMTRMVGFRNVMAHDYDNVNYDVVDGILRLRLVDIEFFVAAVRKFLDLV